MISKSVIPESVHIPAGMFIYHVVHKMRVGRCPLHDHGPRLVELPAFEMDRTPVTNAAYAEFLRATGYQPRAPRNFLRHWVVERGGDVERGICPPDLADHPVVWVSPEDAEAYARWQQKRLPTDEEWQWAAQGVENRAWPWGDQFDSSRCNHDSPGTTPVDRYPQGVSPFGCLDMAGNAWEWIGPTLDVDWHRSCFIRGGSYYLPRGSFWYIEGGAQRNNHHVRIFLLNAALNRAATVGFRCVKGDDR